MEFSILISLRQDQIAVPGDAEGPSWDGASIFISFEIRLVRFRVWRVVFTATSGLFFPILQVRSTPLDLVFCKISTVMHCIVQFYPIFRIGSLHRPGEFCIKMCLFCSFYYIQADPSEDYTTSILISYIYTNHIYSNALYVSFFRIGIFTDRALSSKY